MGFRSQDPRRCAADSGTGSNIRLENSERTFYSLGGAAFLLASHYDFAAVALCSTMAGLPRFPTLYEIRAS
jgi:hypothetical protein